MPLIPAAESDLETIAALVNRAYRGREGWAHEGDYITGPRTTAAYLAEDLAATPGARLMTLRAAPEGPIDGVVWLEPADGGVWYLGMLTVRTGLQDRGTGRRLLDEAEALVEAQGGRRVRMTVISVRETLIAWYLRRGYALTGETEPFPYGDERLGRPTREGLEFVVLEKAIGDI